GSFAAVNGILVFPGRDANGCELWRSDGVTADLLMDINPGPGNSMWPSSTSSFTDLGGFVLFGADDGVDGLELWVTDGARATRVEDIAEGAGWSRPSGFTPVGPLVLFAADDHVVGKELWAIPTSVLHRALREAGGAPNPGAQDPPPAKRRKSRDEFRAFLPS